MPKEKPAYTVNMACGSGLKAIDLGFRAVRDGDADVVLAGGVESMSRVPYLLTEARWGYRLGHQEAVDGMYRDGFHCPLCDKLMGETAETLAEQYSIPREEQDAFALRSQQRAARAWDEGRFAAETFPVKVKGYPKGEIVKNVIAVVFAIVLGAVPIFAERGDGPNNSPETRGGSENRGGNSGNGSQGGSGQSSSSGGSGNAHSGGVDRTAGSLPNRLVSRASG